MSEQPTPIADDEPDREDPEHDAEILAFPGPSRLPGDPDVRLRDVIGSVLREERRRQGRTLEEVAGDAAVSVPYLSEVERGRKEVSSDVLAAIHGALGLELGDVLERGSARLRAQRRGPSLLAA